jgi:hypothetical protein
MIDLPALLERGEAYLAMTKAMSGGRVAASDAACIEIIRRAVAAESLVEDLRSQLQKEPPQQ